MEEYAEIENIYDLNILIQTASYTREFLLPIRDAISKFANEQYEENKTFLINYSRILKDFVYISVPEKTEELNNFLEENNFKDYVEIEVAIMIVPYA